MSRNQYIDLDYINDMADGDTGFIIEMITDYKVKVKEYIADLHDAAASKDTGQIKFYAHKLASSFMMMGAKQLNEIAVKIEHAIKDTMTMEQLRNELTRMDELFMNVVKELDHELTLLNASN